LEVAAMQIPFVHVRGQEQTIKVGLIGCGGRGSGAAANVLEAAPNVSLVALADIFPEKVQKVRAMLEKGKDPGVKISEDWCFGGWDAYRRILETPVDYIMLAQPPGFRPMHFEAAVEAGKHIFAEKPVAVDPVGVRRFIAAGEKARQKGIGVLPGTNGRHSLIQKEMVKRIHDGAIGEIVAGRIYFNTGYLWEFPRKPGESDMEWQIRNWYYFDWLSGDHIVEQHVHQHDAANWVLGSHPLRATGVGGRQMRTEEIYGNIYDHFFVDYEYPNGVHVMSMCRQWQGTRGLVGTEWIGTKGRAWMAYANSEIFGPGAWKPDFKEPPSHMQEHRDFIRSIREGKPINDAVRVAESSLTSIMGREAAYTGEVVEWDALMKSDLDLSPAKYEFGPNPVRPVRRPGKA
jgi:predicted dehydrogenase